MQYPRLENLKERSELGGFARKKSINYTLRTVRLAEVEELQASGWEIQRENKNTVRMKKMKALDVQLEDRVWTILYHMGFPHLSGDETRGSTLIGRDHNGDEYRSQIDVVAIDNDVAVAIECKTHNTFKKSTSWPGKVSRSSDIKKKFSDAVQNAYPSTPAHRTNKDDPREVATVLVTYNFDLSKTDKARAGDSNVVLLDEDDVTYYELLIKQVGLAARYQFLAQVFASRKIKNLSIRVPALLSRMGDHDCYTFSVRPDYLLKIAYIAHRAKGQAFDADTYQRMTNKKRLKDIGEYISDGGIFPTNLVVNLDKGAKLNWELAKGGKGKSVGGIYGWLTLNPTYGSASMIDGQHRLYAYSGHPYADKSYVNVLAFDDMDPQTQSGLFTSINSKQKAVPKALLIELQATLNWGNPDKIKRISAIAANVSVKLGHSKASPLYQRIKSAEAPKTNKCCVTTTALHDALLKPGFFLDSSKKGVPLPLPLWREDTEDCRDRTLEVVIGWLNPIADEASDWWDLGAEENGGLAMNDGIRICINVLRSVLEHINAQKNWAYTAETALLSSRLEPYARTLGQYLASMNLEERRKFRNLRGNQGQASGLRQCEEALHEESSDFNPEGLKKWIAEREQRTNNEIRDIVGDIEGALNDWVLRFLKEKYGQEETGWFYEGCPKDVQLKVSQLQIDEGGIKKEACFNFVHYEKIIKKEWVLLGPHFAYSERKNPGKDAGTKWLKELLLLRNAVSHQKHVNLGPEDLSKARKFQDFLLNKIVEFEELGYSLD